MTLHEAFGEDGLPDGYREFEPDGHNARNGAQALSRKRVSWLIDKCMIMSRNYKKGGNDELSALCLVFASWLEDDNV